MTLLEQVKQDIAVFFNRTPEFFFNERDFQMHLALYLHLTGNYDDIDVEYHVPRKFKDGMDTDYFSWDTKTLSIDIMVRKGYEFVPIELKYKLKGISCPIHRFGEYSSNSISIVTDQSAQDLGRYDFWKDVKRIELLKKHFSTVKGGFAVFLTNDMSYKRQPSQDVGYYAFRMNENDVISGELAWKPGCSISKSHKEFNLTGRYSLSWTDFKAKGSANGIDDDIQLSYCIACV